MKKPILFIGLIFSLGAYAQLPQWSYDAGPDPKTKLGKELVDLTANIPNFPEISTKIIGRKQKFRPAFGPIPWRMVLESNKVKILFVGQDGTHIAEAAGRPATAGFGGRAQDFANYFGVNEGAAFINAYAFTIKGQYGVYNTPYIYEDRSGEKSVRMANLVSNDLWLISQDLSSPIVQWRNDLIDWIIKNNKDSMKLIVLFGGAARDSIATYATAKGAEVEARYQDIADQIQVPITSEEYAGGNNTFPSIVSKSGKDLYEEMLGKKLSYTNSKDQRAAIEDLEENLEAYMEKMILSRGGPDKNGLINTAQLGGYDLDSMKVKGVTTRSLKGLKLNDGTVIENDIIVITLPHPSSLSRTVMDADSYAEGLEAASGRVMRDVRVLDEYKQNGWEIRPDLNKINYYARGENYQYGRSDIGPEFYDFGTPENRMVSRSTARRMSGNANVVIIGTRDNGSFSKSAIKEMTEASAAEGVSPEQLFIARPSVLADRYTYDRGPGEDLAKMMVTSLNLENTFKTKSELKCIKNNKVVKTIQSTNKALLECEAGQDKSLRDMSFEKDGISAYNTKTHPSVSDFGHYRGDVVNPKVVILADPQGYDDIVTARALTGTRGQYLQGMMEDLGIDDNYLVLKTVPFGMDGANEAEWSEVLASTQTYRANVMAKIMENSDPVLVIADGEYAGRVIDSLVKDKNIVVVKTKRNLNNLKADLVELTKDIKKALPEFTGREYLGQMKNIPRSHLTFYARVWEGTSGDRAITSTGKKYEGIAFAEVVPKWAYEQDLELTNKSESAVDRMIQVLLSNSLPLPNESMRNYVERINL